MTLKVTETSLPGVLIFEPDVFADERGFFLETFSRDKYAEFGLDRTFVQDNHSRSSRGVLRGLHYQLNRPQGKLVYAVRGEIFDVAVDIRRGSPTFARWFGVTLSDENHRQLFVPECFAHGFCVLSDVADVTYKCTDVYVPGDDFGVLYSDTRIGIDWPVEIPMLSPKDANNPTLADVPPERLPTHNE